VSRSGHDRREQMFRRGLGSPMLFSILWTMLASAIYFALGVIADYALGLTPVVFLASGVMFLLAAMTYVEGSSLHQDRGGSTVFARHAFNELWSFIAGWAVLLDYVILIAATSFSATNYLGAFWEPLGDGWVEVVAMLAILVYVCARNIRGFSTTRSSRIRLLVVADIGIQLLIIVLGMALLAVANTLLMAVNERTYELGILGAIGWSPARILRLILMESMIMTAIGGVGGVGLGIIVMNLVAETHIAAGVLEPYLTASMIAQALISVFLIGPLGALYPAWRAIRLKPADALRAR
jgi:amino acid transporter